VGAPGSPQTKRCVTKLITLLNHRYNRPKMDFRSAREPSTSIGPRGDGGRRRCRARALRLDAVVGAPLVALHEFDPAAIWFAEHCCINDPTGANERADVERRCAAKRLGYGGRGGPLGRSVLGACTVSKYAGGAQRPPHVEYAYFVLVRCAERGLARARPGESAAWRERGLASWRERGLASWRERGLASWRERGLARARPGELARARPGELARARPGELARARPGDRESLRQRRWRRRGR
jgi:hypothetical protein